jgi:N-acetylglucosaminyldiphosphoundecaprenol N-acetyl-beta-D-mannosaminyltransferase
MQLSNFKLFTGNLSSINPAKILITTLNAYSYVLSGKDNDFCDALRNSDVLLPDGIGVVLGIRWLTGKRIQKIAGADLFDFEMKRMEAAGGRVFFLGSSEKTLALIKARTMKDYPAVKAAFYSPPFRDSFFDEENRAMIAAVNAFGPDVLFIGMTAPKQEKWAYRHYHELKARHVCCIGAVFDFYAGTVKRAPRWMIALGLEWFYRLIRELPRMWRRYIIGNTEFIVQMLREKILLRNSE